MIKGTGSIIDYEPETFLRRSEQDLEFKKYTRDELFEWISNLLNVERNATLKQRMHINKILEDLNLLYQLGE